MTKMDYIFYILLFFFCCGSCTLIEEKCCKFEYEYKVLERIVELEHDHKDMKNLATKIQELEDVNHETAKILESQAVVINQLTGTVKQQENQIKSHGSDIDEVKKFTGSTLNRQDDDISDIKKIHEFDIEEVKKLTGSAGSSTSLYTRWGKKDCPKNGTKVVYDGYVGGSSHYHKGAAVDYLCLPKDPIWDQYDDNKVNGAKLYGGEYEIGQGTKYFGQNLFNEDPVCAVCMSSRPNAVMIPGRNKCYPRWTEEYSGYLTAGYYNQSAASKYVCLDKNAQVRENGAADKNGVLFYLVEAVCGSLPCPPYVQGREITCVVCTK